MRPDCSQVPWGPISNWSLLGGGGEGLSDHLGFSVEKIDLKGWQPTILLHKQKMFSYLGKGDRRSTTKFGSFFLMQQSFSLLESGLASD